MEAPIVPAEVVGYAPDPLAAYAYVSTPMAPFDQDALNGLLLAARRFNAAREVTGKLVVLEEEGRVVRFAQWVEGPQRQLAAVVDRIRADERHGGLEVRFEGPVPSRRFPSWEMVYAPAATPGAFAIDVETLTTG